MTHLVSDSANIRDPRPLVLRDWREAVAGDVQALFESEESHWRTAFWWDTRAHWTQIEEARLTWRLPGLLAVDGAGRVQGWSWFYRDSGVMHVGSLVASSPGATTALVQGVIEAARADEGISLFAPDRAPQTEMTLLRHGFDLERYDYLACDSLGAGGSRPTEVAGVTVDEWQDEDLEPAAALLQAAYEGGNGRYFAPRDTPAEWGHYVRGLVQKSPMFDRGISRVLRSDGKMAGVLLAARVGPDTAHIVQLAVAPWAQRRGLGRLLLGESARLAGRAGVTRLTLLVATSNQGAAALYRSRGFTVRAGFFGAFRRGAAFPAQGLPGQSRLRAFGSDTAPRLTDSRPGAPVIRHVRVRMSSAAI